MTKQEWIEIMGIIQGIDHDFTFEHRDLERLFDDGFQTAKSKIIVRLLEIRPKDSDEAKDNQAKP